MRSSAVSLRVYVGLAADVLLGARIGWPLWTCVSSSLADREPRAAGK